SIPIPGRVQSVNMWVWGANYNYWIDAYVRDYQGIDHVVHLGSLNFAGWRNLSAGISTAIPQSRKYIPRYAGLELTKLVMWTAPDEKVDDFYLFIDELTVITDLFETRFDGEDLADPTTLNEIWQQGSK
ncbi:MAG TPA: flagellar filament outer layer protein FlaA, partial [Spirochaetia bacterium]